MRIALLGDTMLGRKVGEAIGRRRPAQLVAPEVAELLSEADLRILNLECCISERGDPWPAPGKRFFFRAPPAAIDVLAYLQVDCVTLANNHALDFGFDALGDTTSLLERAGIRWVGAGRDRAEARRPSVLRAGGERLSVFGATDHPRDFDAAPDGPGVAWAELREGVPSWLEEAVAAEAARGPVLVSPHWGPNMTSEPLPYVRRAGRALLDAGASLIAGHSAHVVHGVAGPVLYDLGDFIDDYATDRRLRNDLGLLVVVDLEGGRLRRLEAFPLALEYCHTRRADGADAAWIRQRFRRACRARGTDVRAEPGRLLATWPPESAPSRAAPPDGVSAPGRSWDDRP